MRPDADRDDELLAAYVDGVTELTPDERRRVERRIEQDPIVHEDEAATRALVGQLRELAPAHGEPDWAALERSIADAVGPDVPRRWWRGWRLVLPGLAVAATAAIIVMLQHPAAVTDAPVADHGSHVAPGPTHQPAVAEAKVALWLDGAEVELDLDGDADALLDEPLFGPDDPADELLDRTAGEGLLTPSELAWTIDELDDESLGRAEGWLDHADGHGQPAPHRKKG
jgi:anti-sigma factor RsiW